MLAISDKACRESSTLADCRRFQTIVSFTTPVRTFESPTLSKPAGTRTGGLMATPRSVRTAIMTRDET